MRAEKGTVQDQVLGAITDKGVTSQEVAKKLDIGWMTVRKTIAKLCEQGLVHRAKFSPKVVWYFRTEGAAKAFQRPLKVAVSSIVPVRTQSGFDRAAKVVQPAHVQIQQGPAYRSPLERMEPLEKGAFASAGIGRYLTEEMA